MDPETFCQSCSMPLDNPNYRVRKRWLKKPRILQVLLPGGCFYYSWYDFKRNVINGNYTNGKNEYRFKDNRYGRKQFALFKTMENYIETGTVVSNLHKKIRQVHRGRLFLNNYMGDDPNTKKQIVEAIQLSIIGISIF